jgi:hypothetical protein
MITLILYAVLAIACLVLALGLLRKPKPHDLDETTEEKSYAPSIGNGRWLDLSERIFDPSDARWLEEELAFPKLANALMLDRKQLAIRWLEALQASFDEMVRTPEFAPSSDSDARSSGSWRALWLVIRFKLLVTYALLVVKFFGPYHRLIPSFARVQFSQGSKQAVPGAAWAASRGSH